MNEKKYASEFAVLMTLGPHFLLQQAEFELCGNKFSEFEMYGKEFVEKNPCHIYFILRRSKVTLDPNYCVKNKNTMELKYFIHEQDKRHERRLQIKILDADKYDFHSKYPYNYFYLINNDNSGPNHFYKLASKIDEEHKNSREVEPLLDLEVLYIGQAFGENGERTPITRLDSHSTLQKIYAKAMQNNPDSDIWILLTSFKQTNISAMNGSISMLQENKKDDFKRWVNFYNKDFSEQQRINFTEAALIRTFLPEYNQEYKNTFPNPAHSSYSECYSLDINLIVVEMDTSDYRRWLYSASKPGKIDKDRSLIPYWQYGRFHFVNDEDRYKMFNYEYLGECKKISVNKKFS
jgi:hypothetical protein